MKSIFKPSQCLSRQQITDYLTNKSTGEALHQIENHLLDCPLCSTAVDSFAQQPDIKTAIQRTEGLDYSNRTATVRWLRPFKAVASVAAVATISFGAGWWVFNSNSPDQLFADYYTSYANDATLSLRGDNPEEYSTEKNPLTAALNAYDNGDFNESIQLLSQRLAQRPDDGIATYFLGLSYLEISQLETAASYLETARINSDRYYNAATWYLALTQLKLNNESSAKLLLEELKSSSDSFYTKKATQLLKEL